jgi:hypothetical protein
VKRTVTALAVLVAFAAVFVLSRHSTAPSGSTTTTTAAASTTTTSAALPNCQGADFSGAYDQGQGAAGTIYAAITLTKTSLGQCAVDGWPRLTLQDHYGSPLPSRIVDLPSSSSAVTFPDSRANVAPKPFTMRQGDVATFSLAYSDVPVGNETCPAAQTISVALHANHSTVAVTPQFAPQPCNGGLVWVSPLYPNP